MANVGTAQLTITPKFDNLSARVNSAIAGVNTTQAGTKLGSGISAGVSGGLGGLAKSGALVGAFSSVTSKAMDVISSHVGSAAARLDTLKNYPQVMQSLGVGADEAQRSIQTMSDRLSNLPTRLDDMASTVQGLYAATKDYGVSLTTATDAGLALNDMMLAGGQGTAVASAAMEQFRQMLSKGKPDMQDWKSLISAAPGQMDQLAKSMLGPTANANDLYAALGGGKHEATISMQQLLDAMIQLDQQGGAGLASLSDQAEQASGGLQTAMDNTGNAVTKGLENVMDAFGRDNITAVMGDVKGAINGVFSDVASQAASIQPKVSVVWSDMKNDVSRLGQEFKSTAGDVAQMLPPFEQVRGKVRDVLNVVIPLAPAITGVVVATKGIQAGVSGFHALQGVLGKVSGGLTKASGVVSNIAQRVFDGAGALGEFSGVAEGAGMKLAGLSQGLEGAAGVMTGPWGIAIAAGVAGLGLLVGKYLEAKQKNDDFKSAMDGVTTAMDKTHDVMGVTSDSIENVGNVAGGSAKSIEDLTTSISNHEQSISNSMEAAQQQIAVLETAQGIIDQFAGKTDLTTTDQGKLAWAIQQVNDQLGLNITQSDVAADKYADQDGNVQDLTQSLDQLIQKKEEEARVSALTSSLTDAYKAQYDAANTLADAQSKYNDELDNQTQKFESQGHSYDEARTMAENYMNTQANMTDSVTWNLNKAKDAYDSTSLQVDQLTAALGNSESAANGAAGAYSGIGATFQLFQATLTQQGQSLGDFQQALSDVGASTDQLSQLSEGDLVSLVQGWNGTTDQLMDRLAQLGIGFDATKESLGQFTEALGVGFGISADQVDSMFSQFGINVQDFQAKCGEMGVTSDQVSSINQEAFSAMLQSCGGNIDTLIAMIQQYNASPIQNKDGSVNVDTAQLFDAQGQVYTWNGSQLVDQNGNAAIADTKLTDAQGHLWTWDGSNLIDQNASADVNDVQLVDAQGNLYTWNGSDLIDQNGTTRVSGNLHEALGWISSWNSAHLNPLEGVINIVKNITGGSNAAGGIVARRHATGAIFRSPTWIGPADIIGEAGAEYYDGTNIVPLTNRRYSQPFADIIAEETARRMGGGGKVVNQKVTNNFYERDDMYVAGTIISRALMAAAGAQP
ncbi:MAG: tape measure protein [Atopobiaceae bacterium]